MSRSSFSFLIWSIGSTAGEADYRQNLLEMMRFSIREAARHYSEDTPVLDMFRRFSFMDPQTGFFTEKYLPEFYKTLQKKELHGGTVIRFRVSPEQSEQAAEVLKAWEPEGKKIVTMCLPGLCAKPPTGTPETALRLRLRKR